MKPKLLPFAAIAGVALLAPLAAHADKLDDVLSSGTLRCGVMLDFPPAGFRDESNQPAGYDVDYCKDMAEALGVEAEIVETPSPQRIPALVANQVDVGIASTTATLERAKTVAFSIPYMVYKDVVLVRKDSEIDEFDKLRGKPVATVRGTTPELEYLENCEQWEEGCTYESYGSDSDQTLALRQGKADAVFTSSAYAAALVASTQGEDLEVCCDVPGFTDWTGIIVNRNERGFLDWINLFVWRQVESGRYAELYQKWVNDNVPTLALDNVHW